MKSQSADRSVFNLSISLASLRYSLWEFCFQENSSGYWNAMVTKQDKKHTQNSTDVYSCWEKP